MGTIPNSQRRVHRESLRQRRQRIVLEYLSSRRGSIVFEPNAKPYAELAERGLSRAMVDRLMEDLEMDQLIRITRGCGQALHVELTIDAPIRN